MSERADKSRLKTALRLFLVITVIALALAIWRTFRAWATYAEAIFFSVLLLIGILLWARRLVLRHGREVFHFSSSVYQSVKRAVATNPEVQKLVSRHPSIFSFLKRRLTRESFSGLPLTFLTILFLYVLGLFAGLIQDVLSSDPIVSVDVRLEHLFYAFRNGALVEFFLWITLLGKANVLIAFSCALSGTLWLFRKRSLILPLWISLGGSALTSYLGKFALHRTRPDGTLPVYLEKTYSFPSGHATASVAFYGFLVVILWGSTNRWTYRINALFAAFGLFFAIGLSRLYLGVHYLSDVIGGYLLGWLWLIIGVSLHGWFTRNAVKESVRVSQRAVATSLILGLGASIYYVQFATKYEPSDTLPARRVEQPVVRTNNVFNEFSQGKIPRLTETLSGDKQEPLSFVFVVRDEQRLIAGFEKVHWRLADMVSVASIFNLVKALATESEYPTAPMTPSFWNAKVHDLGFEKSVNSSSPKIRHHLRVWKTNIETDDGGKVFVGTASFDSGSKWGLVHRIDANIDKEREVLFDDLQSNGEIDRFSKELFVDPMYGTNFLGDPFFTDGKVYLIFLKR